MKTIGLSAGEALHVEALNVLPITVWTSTGRLSLYSFYYFRQNGCTSGDSAMWFIIYLVSKFYL